jgi:uncharacterized membrane protein
MDEWEIHLELERLAHRLTLIELHLGLAPPVQPKPVTPVREVVPRPASAPPPPAPVAVAAGKAPSKPRASLEVLIGERWMAWVGAIVVVVAAGFFVKLAYDLGWWGRLSPLAKCLVTAAFGTVLVAAGEIALRLVGRVAAVSLFGAGLGTLYLTAYATFRFFDLLPPGGAFWLMFLVAALGLGITLRGRMLAIGVLSLLGGYLTPVLLARAPTFATALPLYATMLLAIALSVSAILPAPFRALRYVGVALHVAVATLWAYREGADHWRIALIFMTLWWAMVTAEVLLAAFRGQSPRGNAVVSLLFTFWYASIGCGVLAVANPGQRNWLGLFTMAIAAACAWIAVPFGPGLAVLKLRPRRAMERMAATLWAQFGVLCAAAVAVQFHEQGNSFGQSIGWLVMGVACVEVGRRLPAWAVSVFGLLIGALGLIRVWVLDYDIAVLRTIIWSYGDVRVDYWALLALGAVMATHFAALRVRSRNAPAGGGLAVVLNVLSVLQWLALCGAQCRALALTAGWLVGVSALLATAPLARRRGHVHIALVVLLATAGRWLLFDALPARLSSSWTAATIAPIANWQMAVALAIAVGGYWIYRQWTSKAEPDAAPADEAPTRSQVPLFGAILFLLVALSFEIDRVLSQGHAALGAPKPLWPVWQELALWWTLLWAAGGLTSLIVGRMARLRVLLSGGSALVLIAAVIWLLSDTLYWRIDRGVVLAPIAANLQFVVGLLVATIIVAAAWIARRADVHMLAEGLRSSDMAAVGAGLAIAIGLWLGSLELDRFFAPEAGRVGDAAMARQTALSVYWGLYAIALVGVGFWRRLPWMRYGGLALLAIALGKVMLVDLAHVRYVYRVLSLLAIGLLFIATSIAYARLASGMRERGDSGPSLPDAKA